MWRETEEGDADSFGVCSRVTRESMFYDSLDRRSRSLNRVQNVCITFHVSQEVLYSSVDGKRLLIRGVGLQEHGRSEEDHVSH